MTTKVIKLKISCTIRTFQSHLNNFLNKMFPFSIYAVITVKLITSFGKEIELEGRLFIRLSRHRNKKL